MSLDSGLSLILGLRIICPVPIFGTRNTVVPYALTVPIEETAHYLLENQIQEIKAKYSPQRKKV